MERPLGLLTVEEEVPMQGPDPRGVGNLVENAGMGDSGPGRWRQLSAVHQQQATDPSRSWPPKCKAASNCGNK